MGQNGINAEGLGKIASILSDSREMFDSKVLKNEQLKLIDELYMGYQASEFADSLTPAERANMVWQINELKRLLKHVHKAFPSMPVTNQM